MGIPQNDQKRGPQKDNWGHIAWEFINLLDRKLSFFPTFHIFIFFNPNTPNINPNK